MTLRIVVFIISIVILESIYSQGINEINKAIATIESISLDEDETFSLKNMTIIKHDTLIQTICIITKSEIGNEYSSLREVKFFKEDVFKETFNSSLIKVDDMYVVNIQIKAKKQTIQYKSIIHNQNEIEFPITESTYRDEVWIATEKRLPLNYAYKLIEAYKVIFGITKEL